MATKSFRKSYFNSKPSTPPLAEVVMAEGHPISARQLGDMLVFVASDGVLVLIVVRGAKKH